MPKTLIYAIGNPSRQDDALGPIFIEKIKAYLEENNLTHIHTDCNYQLNIEDADNISAYEQVIFVDACVDAVDCFELKELKPSDEVNFTMHSVSPTYILHLCQQIYGKYPKTHILKIKGYEWDMKEGLSKKAKENLDKALEFICPHLHWADNQS